MAAATISVDIADFEKLLLKLGAAAPKALQAGLLSAAMRAQTIVVAETQRKRVFNTGHYEAAWKAERIVDGIRLYNLAPYAGIIEYGRRPGRRPRSEWLIPWVMRKFRLPQKAAAGIAFVVARKIGQKGIPGRYVLRDAMPKIEKAVAAEVTYELRRALRSIP